jgi:hypothetical protein
MLSNTPARIFAVPPHRTSPEPNFFDRFDRKEQSGLGGRNKALVSPLLQQSPGLGYGIADDAMYQMPPQFHQGRSEVEALPHIVGYTGGSPVRLLAPPARFSSGAVSPPLGPPLTEHEMMLLKGIRPPQLSPPTTGMAKTYRTSAVLDMSHTHNTNNNIVSSEADEFFEQVAQLRSSHGTNSLMLVNGEQQEVNVYGTPLMTAKQRQLELMRRPSFATHHQQVSIAGPSQYMPHQQATVTPQESFIPVGRPNNKQQRVLVPGVAAVQSRSRNDGESVYSLPLASAVAEKPLLASPSGGARGQGPAKGLSTQEASEIQSQLHNLRRQDAELDAHFREELLAPLRLRKEPPISATAGLAQQMNPITGQLSHPPSRVLPPYAGAEYRPPAHAVEQQHVSASRAPSVSPTRSHAGMHIPVVPSPMKGTAGLPGNAMIAGGPPGLLDDIFMKYSALAEVERLSLKPNKKKTVPRSNSNAATGRGQQERGKWSRK